MNLLAKIFNKEEVVEIKTGFTFKDKISKAQYLELKNNLKANSEAANSIRKAAVNNKGQVRYYLRDLKRSQGQKARVYHLALCFLRGKKYSEVEPNCKDKVSSKTIFEILCWRCEHKYARVLREELENFINS